MCSNNEENEETFQRLLKLFDEVDYLKDDLETWTDALEELSEIEEAFETNGSYDLCEKTILDVGTDAVKPLYIALKLKPKKIVNSILTIVYYPWDARAKFPPDGTTNFSQKAIENELKGKCFKLRTIGNGGCAPLLWIVHCI
jgi:hypothetical protein